MRLLLPSVVVPPIVVSSVVVSLLVDSVMVAIGPFMIAAAIKYSDRNVCSELYLISDCQLQRCKLVNHGCVLICRCV